MGKRNTKPLQRLRVPLGFIFGAVFIVFAAPTPVSLVVGIVIAFAGLLLRAWSSGHIRKNRELATTGPYAYTRNPLYLGSFVMGAGFMVASANWWLGLLFAALFTGIYLPVMRIEAGELTEIFGDVYSDYARQVPLFIPYGKYFKGAAKKFELELYLRYREYQAGMGFFAVAGLLILKAYLYSWNL